MKNGLNYSCTLYAVKAVEDHCSFTRRLFLGLFSFESHFAHYRPGDFYKKHYDAFKGESNRKLSIVTYLNPAWANDDGGELVLYRGNTDQEGLRVVPLMGTIVVFFSEDFPHEVLAANRDRYSIAGWFRVNSSVSDRATHLFNVRSTHIETPSALFVILLIP